METMDIKSVNQNKNYVTGNIKRVGSSSTRTDPIHRLAEKHPGDWDFKSEMSGLPNCPFGNGCYNRNLHHFRQFAHPPSKPTRRFDADDEQENIVSLIENIQLTQYGVSQTIRARITIKSDKHPFSNTYGQSEMFTMDLLDNTAEIRLTAFGPCVEQFYNLVEVDQVYYFSNFTVKNANLSKAHIHKYSLTCTGQTKIIPCHKGTNDIPYLTFDFKPIANIHGMDKNEMIDILAICEDYGECQDVTLKGGFPGRKRELWLVDQFNEKIMLTIWGNNAENFVRYRKGCVIALKLARVLDYPYRSLDSSCLSSSTFQVNPDLLEAHLLYQWYHGKEDGD